MAIPHRREGEIPDLPCPAAALEPQISAETLSYHHGKHHRAYPDKLNDRVAGTEREDDIDYRNARPPYTEAYWNLVNREFTSQNF